MESMYRVEKPENVRRALDCAHKVFVTVKIGAKPVHLIVDARYFLNLPDDGLNEIGAVEAYCRTTGPSLSCAIESDDFPISDIDGGDASFEKWYDRFIEGDGKFDPATYVSTYECPNSEVR